jgi:hypothetical protein
VRLKKSYDYFKTLKDLSGCIGRVYCSADRPDLYKKEMLFYNSIRKELSLRLSEEFVAPIERNDIYSLSSLLSCEIDVIDYICHLAYQVDLHESDEELSSFFIVQGDLLYDLSNRKSYSNILNEIYDIQSCIRIKRRALWDGYKTTLVNNGNALLRYVYFDKTIELIDCLSRSFGEIERVVINNL